MKQLIFLLLVSILIISCDSDITNPSNKPVENNYHELIQGFWQGDSIIFESGATHNLDIYYTFYEDTLKKQSGNISYWAYELFNDSIALTRANAGFCDMKILELNESSMKLLGLWNNSIMYFHKE